MSNTPEPVEFPLADLTLDVEFQCRPEGIDKLHVLDLVEAIEAGAVLVLRARRLPDRTTVVVDGHHSAQAYRQAKRTTAPTIITAGTREDAILDATAANREHLAKKRTRATVREAIRRTLLVRHQDWNNTQVAQHVGASDKTVALVRAEMEGRSEIPNVSTRPDTLGLHQPTSKPSRTSDQPKSSGRNTLRAETEDWAARHLCEEKHSPPAPDQESAAHPSAATVAAAANPPSDPATKPAAAPPTPSRSVAGWIGTITHLARQLKNVRVELSELMASEHGEWVKAASDQHPHCGLYRTENTIRHGDLGHVRFGISEWSNAALDELLGYVGVLILRLERAAESPTSPKPSPAPWELPEPGRMELL